MGWGCFVEFHTFDENIGLALSRIYLSLTQRVACISNVILGVHPHLKELRVPLVFSTPAHQNIGYVRVFSRHVIAFTKQKAIKSLSSYFFCEPFYRLIGSF